MNAEAWWGLVMRRTSRERPAVTSAMWRMVRRIRDDLTASRLRTASVDTGVDIARLLPVTYLAQISTPVSKQLFSTFVAGGQFALRQMPRTEKVTFNVMHPTIPDAMQTVVRKTLGSLQTDILTLVQQETTTTPEIRTPLEERVRGVVGLSPSQLAGIEAYRQRLIREGKPPHVVARLVGIYQARRVAVHMDAISRTATLDAFKAGQHAGMEQAVLQGLLFGDRLMKTWVNMGDARVRDEHKDRGGMGGQTVPWNQRYSNGEMIPGELTWNCRCVSQYSLQF